MKRTGTPQLLTLMTLLIASLATLGCETDGPEFVTGDSRIVEGSLQPEETLDSDFFALTRAGTVNIQASLIIGRNPETEELLEAPELGFGVGQPNPEDPAQCQLTFSQILSEGDSFSVYFREGLFCISTFRNPGALEGAIYEYVVTMTGAFS